jgi:antitoxin Phd
MTSPNKTNLQTWAVQDAKAKFSELLEACVQNGPQIVTKRGLETAVLVPMAEWRRLKSVAKPTLKELLLSDQGRTDFLIPSRGNAKRRKIEVVQ